mmetsp:Transcript_58998/g.97540  ORF Transcript_58998/g.97540 Transcript_58998/m.97540 type:complete len:85 (+) Transcript_58998:162-416(+)
MYDESKHSQCITVIDSLTVARAGQVLLFMSINCPSAPLIAERPVRLRFVAPRSAYTSSSVTAVKFRAARLPCYKLHASFIFIVR